MKLNSLTNVRPTYDLGCQIIAAPTEGGFKISDDAATLLGVTNGDRVDVGEHPAQRGVFFIGKGYEDKERHLINGGKIKKSGSYFLFSAANAWHRMGDSEHNTHYDVLLEPIEFEDDNFDTPRIYYGITFDKKVAKQQSDVNQAKEYTETDKDALDNSADQEPADQGPIPESAGNVPSDVDAGLDEL